MKLRSFCTFLLLAACVYAQDISGKWHVPNKPA
jgi:hypothetical protein